MSLRCPQCEAENPSTSKFCAEGVAPLGTNGPGIVCDTRTLENPSQGIPQGSLIAERYRILEEIGRGGMGVVFKAEDIKLRRIVALKFLPAQWTSDAVSRERFVHEARAASALDHPNICTIYEIDETEAGRLYISMACYDGESLRERIQRGPLETEDAVGIAHQVAQGMSKAHQKGIVHRDLKPANILITSDGIAKIVDFGLAKLAGQVKLTREGSTIGTAAYMSPEQARGEEVDQRTDIWSLGVVLYEMLAGRLPFKGDLEQSLIHSILKTEPEPIARFRKDLPTGLAKILGTALAKNPADRYQTMNDLIEDLNAAGQGRRPLRAETGLFQGRIFGVKKTFAYALSGLVALSAIALVFFFPKSGQAYDSIAILPFVNLSPNPEPNDASDMLTNELILKLFAVEKLQVRPFRQVQDYRKTKKSNREIGKELRVKAIVDPTISRRDHLDRVDITIWDVGSPTPLFYQRYEHEQDDILILLAEVARDVVRETRVSQKGQERERLNSSAVVNRKAFDCLLKAKKSLARISSSESVAEPWHSAYRYLREAIDLDRGFASAYWQLVTGYYYNGIMWGLISFQDADPLVRAALKTGSAIDPDSSERHFAIGTWKYVEWDWEGARKELQRAVELEPGNDDAAIYYSVILSVLGRFDESIAIVERTSTLEPVELARILGMAYSNARRYDEAISNLRKVIEIAPNDMPSLAMLALTLAENGQHRQGAQEADKFLAIHPGSERTFLYLYLAIAYAYAGRKSDAVKLINEYLAFQKGKPIESFNIAQVFSVLGEKDEAFRWLERAYQERSHQMQWLKIDPTIDNLRSDSRYKEYLKKAGFEN